MNELAIQDLDPLSARLPSLRDINMDELAYACNMPVTTRERIQRDHPNLWRNGHLPVLPGDYWEYISLYSTPNREVTPRLWINVRKLGSTSVLVPNWPSSPNQAKHWGVMIYDSTIGFTRPIIFPIDPYLESRQPALECITDRGECISHLCAGEDHHCVMYNNDDVSKGGHYFWCECESK